MADNESQDDSPRSSVDVDLGLSKTKYEHEAEAGSQKCGKGCSRVFRGDGYEGALFPMGTDKWYDSGTLWTASASPMQILICAYFGHGAQIFQLAGKPPYQGRIKPSADMG